MPFLFAAVSFCSSFKRYSFHFSGTVDSGHLCLSGCNEVIMLRRMPERNKKHALYLLNGKEENRTSYDALYGLPHGDNLGEKPMWPSLNAIQECVDMNYYPSVFILKPGQFVHINKGRLHAFRKMSTSNLPPTDCHSKLRQKNIEKLKLGTSEQICISVAWDWMYRGVTSEGINREIVSTLDCAELLRHHRTQSLAIPETAILHMASHFVSEYEHEQEQEKSVPLSAIRGRETSFLPSQGLSSDYDLLLRAIKRSRHFWIFDEPVGAFRLGGVSGSYRTYFENFLVMRKNNIQWAMRMYITARGLAGLFLRNNFPHRFHSSIKRFFK